MKKAAGYAINVHDMHDGMHDLLLFNDSNDAEWAENQLHIINDRVDNGDIDDYEYYDMLHCVYKMADDYIEEINFRTEIDNNNVWTALDDSKWQIINIVSIPIWN